jgi:hypothetical protein
MALGNWREEVSGIGKSGALKKHIMASSALTVPTALPPIRTRNIQQGSGSKRTESVATTVFDRLYEEYFPFRLYADYMLGVSVDALAKRFGLPEDWVAERIEAVRLLNKQVRLNLLEVVDQPPTVQ